ncbi:MAG TPA: hypothetical protein DIU00_11500, partial [Phycisphaerales bacterium]|nr:hypothetical protein [Phycisphaerales bacterium]
LFSKPYLINNLGAIRDELTKGNTGLDPSVAHAFLGRVLFTCYLCDRGIIDLQDYFPNRDWTRLLDVLESDAGRDPRSDLYGKLFRKLKDEFNGSMFDDDLKGEKDLIQPVHLEAIRRFLNGDEVLKGQRSLGFWAYDFGFIPVETISAIYEDFLEKEGGPEKRKSGAYHTPRFLAEMTLDLALENMRPLRGKRFLDPAVGSGIFLVLVFNRLAAEWRASHRGEIPLAEQAKDLRALLGSLRGVDKNLTACRIACFSLYLAFLDQFDPPSLRAYMKATGEQLPSLLKFANGKKKAPVIPVIWEKDFLQLAADWKGLFDIVVGNPPWAGRGSKQIAHKFMEAAPDVLKDDSGRACLLLPSKVFLNRTDEFQSRWLRRVTLDKVVQLADYRFILFKEALCPCNIARFTSPPPDTATHEIEYVAPKVSRMDLRDGVIPVAPHDRKWIPLQLLLHAAQPNRKLTGLVWKSHFWGTRRDLKCFDFLLSLPRLSDYAGTVAQMRRGEKRWCKGTGFQPLRPDSKTDKPQPIEWPMSDRFVTPELIKELISVPQELSLEFGSYLQSEGYLLDKAHRIRKKQIYEHPLVLWNKGFTDAAFFDYSVRFQDSLRSIAGAASEIENLMFLAAFMRSKLARYFVFHTSANLGTERDQVHISEVMRLPFYLADSQVAGEDSAGIIAKIAARIRRLKDEMEVSAAKLDKKLRSTEFRLRSEDEDTDDKVRRKWLLDWREKSRKIQAELEPLIYAYFGLNKQEIALVEDTCEIFDKSDTPGSLDGAKNIPTQQPVDADGLEPYAGMLTATLNSWASGTLHVSASGGVDSEVGLGLVKLDQTKSARSFKPQTISRELVSALQRLEEASTERAGTLAYLRRPWVFNETRIYIVKPAIKGQWTRTAALNDAADIYNHIAEARRRAK